jgi:hypothetical protein
MLVIDYGFHQVHLYVGVYRDYYMNKFPKLHSPNKLACVSFFPMFFFHYAYSRHTQCRLIGSLQFTLPFLLVLLAGKAVDAYHFHWVALPGFVFFGMSCVFPVLRLSLIRIYSSPRLVLLSFVDPESFMHVSALYTCSFRPY